MPTQTTQAVQWAYAQTFDSDGTQVPITKDTAQPLVDAVRGYFNTNNVSYATFSYLDLQPFL